MKEIKYFRSKLITARLDSDIERGAFCEPGYDDVMVTSLPASCDTEQWAGYQLKIGEFNEFFVPVDIETIRQQLKKEVEGLALNLRNAIELFYSGQNRSLDVDRREQLFVDDVLDAVLAVVGLTESES